MHWTDIVTAVFLALGCLVAVTGTLGVLRLPDFYSRLHAAGKTDSLAQALIMVGLLFQTWKYDGLVLNAAARLVLITGFILMTSPIATHAVTKAAYLHGLEPWRKDGSKNA